MTDRGPIRCPYCNVVAELVDNREVYGSDRYPGSSYLCRPCEAWVGCHKGTSKPLGRLANAELRKWKQRAHLVFDPIWQDGELLRKQAYAWLAWKMGVHTGDCHIGMMDVDECQRVVELCTDRLLEGIDSLVD